MRRIIGIMTMTTNRIIHPVFFYITNTYNIKGAKIMVATEAKKMKMNAWNDKKYNTELDTS